MPQWTIDQQKVIDIREQNMLVSAAAGSGKTAVLVERIIQRVLDEKHPIEIDRIVVVTFTKAAAAEMRERILAAIQDKLAEQPDNAYLMRQATLVHNAQITTIDSFCNYIVRNHFHEIDLEPDYRIGDEGEMKLIRNTVMDAMMQKQYEEAESVGEDAFFYTFLNAYAKGNSDQAVTDMILRLYDKAQSYPWPAEWLQSVADAYAVSSVEELKNSVWFRFLIGRLREEMEEAAAKTKQLLQCCMMPEGPSFYAAGLEQDIILYEDILAFAEPTRFYEAFCSLKYGAIGRKPRNFDGDEVLMNRVKDGRDSIKKKMDKARNAYGAYTLEEIVTQMEQVRPFVEELVRLTLCFTTMFAENKRSRNVLDFNDVEHFALSILKDEKTKQATATAREFRDYFQEIMIDEYQDSNYIQEEILSSVSKEEQGAHNMFMVGDVKQSIYSFRQACPEIFMDKYERFHGNEEGNIAIDLHQNFRSREEVLSFTNDVFYQLMHKDIGNVEYDDLAALYPGASYYPKADTDTFQTEILIASRNQEEMEEAGIEDNISFEAKMIADKLHRMQGHQLVTDKKTGELRPMRYRDVVILLRSPGAMAEDMIAVLEENGIPAFTENKTGYYDAMEVQTVLNLLRIIDNPRQDIPFAAVLHSAMFAFSSDEIAKIRMTEKKNCLLEAMEAYRDAHPVEQKVGDFLDFLAEMRALVADTPIHMFIEMLLRKTGYLTYVTAMPRGESRRANLEKLIDQAVMYENTSYKGLFQFINYIGQLQKYEVNEGEAQLISDHDDAVAIMSIHKSKGLEFPIVFVSGMGKQFNTQDQKGQMLLHKDMGVGLDLVDYDAQTKTVPLYKQVVARALHSDACGEEMRVLYVALTRAKEKLVLTATLNKAEETLEKWQENRGMLTFSEREEAQGYLEWIIRATAAKRELYPITVVKAEEVVLEEVAGLIEKQQKKEALPLLAGQAKASWVEALDAQMQYVYPYEQNGVYKNKYSVSEIKHQQMEKVFADDFSERPDFLQEKAEPIVPSFITKTEKDEVSRGALRGTAMHRFLECFDFSNYDGEKSMYEQLETMCQSGRLQEEQRKLLQMDRIHCFLESELAKRMKVAATKKQLYIEKPFVMSVSPKELFLEEKDSEDTVLVQGIVDVFFVEEDGIVLLDYKTDRVKEAEELTKRYQAQLQLYAKALQRTMDLPVKEIWIYSFYLEKMIAL